MKILNEGKGYVYEITCDECGSKLEAERDEVKCRRLGDDIYDFHCPVCDQQRSTLSCLMKKRYL